MTAMGDARMTVLQRICRFLANETHGRGGYTVSDFTPIVEATEQSVRIAVKKGIKMNALKCEEHGSFRLYSLGERGELVANLPVDFRTYADLHNTINVLARNGTVKAISRSNSA